MLLVMMTMVLVKSIFVSTMAQTIIWGLPFSPILTLVVLPCFYAVLDDLLVWVQRFFGWEVSGTVRQVARGPAQAARDGGEEAGVSPVREERSEGAPMSVMVSPPMDGDVLPREEKTRAGKVASEAIKMEEGSPAAAASDAPAAQAGNDAPQKSDRTPSDASPSTPEETSERS